MFVPKFNIQAIRLRPRFSLIALLLIVSIALLNHAQHHIHQFIRLPAHQRYNVVMQKSPSWAHPYLYKITYDPAGLLKPPAIIPGLREAPWAGSWKLPTLTPPMYGSNKKGGSGPESTSASRLVSPAMLMIHIFSMPNQSSRNRRHLIRNLDLLDAVPDKYRHLIEIKFVIGIHKELKEDEEGYKENLKEDEEIEKESRMYGDLIRLRLLENGENMNNGKSWEWLRYVGREGGREAWWVLKCDDDTLPLLPNLIPLLLSLDPTKPSYFGSSLGKWTGYHYYFEGMMYGFSWGVVKTMAVADVDRSTRNYQWDEDARMGSTMFSLPLSPKADPNSTICSPPDIPDPKWSLPPPNPDPCTGLVRIDMASRIGEWGRWLIDDERTAVAWHQLKSDEDYLNAYTQAKEGFESLGREYRWNVPTIFRSVAER